MQKFNFKKALPHIVALVSFLVISIAYFHPQLQGKQIRQGDIMSWRAMSQEVNSFKEKTGEDSNWTNSMFGGMPAYQINANQPGSFLPYLSRLFTGGFSRGIGIFFLLTVGFYVMLLSLNVGPWLSMIMAIAFSFSTGNMVLYEAGHVSKLRAIAYCAPVIAGVLLAYKRKWLLGGILFTVGMAMTIYSNHYQMTYYLFLTLVIYVIAELIHAVRTKEVPNFFKASAFLAVCTIFAISTNATKLYTTYTYSKDTMRGDPILTKTDSSENTSSETEGLAWNYAMNWSNGVKDLLASFIPGVVGGGSAEPVSKGSALHKDRVWKNVMRSNKNIAPMYWGDLPFTSGPYYFGALIFFLFILGLFIVPGRIKWWLGLAVLFTVLLSMGRNFEFLSRLFFDYVPMFNKFRTPNSILTVTGIFIPLLAALSVKEIFKHRSEPRIWNGLKWTSIIFIVINVGLLLLGTSLFDFSSAGDARYSSQGLDVGPLEQARLSLFRADILRTIAIMAIGAIALWLFIKNKLNKVYLLLTIGLITIGDLWMVDRRYVTAIDFISAKNYSRNFAPRPVDQEILKDKDPNYRVLDLSVATFESAIPSYHHKAVGGYHAAKLQRYQDIIDRHLSKNNRSVLNMLNTKYIITQDQQVRPNGAALGNAWFVRSVQEATSADAEINALTTIDPATTAVIHQDFKSYLDKSSYSGDGSITLTTYAPNQLSYTSNSSQEQLAVFSEIWYGPDKGWQAYLDGNQVDHIRANYVLRAMKIPAGQHKIEFKFEPNTLRGLTTGASLLLILGMIAGLFFWYRLSGERE